MYKRPEFDQISVFDFNQSYGMHLDLKNEWILRARQVDWDSLEQAYKDLFTARTGRPAISFRIAFGALIIQKRLQLSDRAIVREIAQNPYLQYFIGLPRFQDSCPFAASAMSVFRRRISEQMIIEANDLLLSAAGLSRGYTDRTGEKILYPQDYVLCMEGIEKLQEMIDTFHRKYRPFPKPRTYQKAMRDEYQALLQAKKRPEKRIRQVLRKELGCLARNIRFIEKYLAAGCEMPEEERACYKAIRQLYEQQKFMYDRRTHDIEDRIVSISGSGVRRDSAGKAGLSAEAAERPFILIDENGTAWYEKLQLDPCDEDTIFIDALNRYCRRKGYYPDRVRIDPLFRTKAVRAFCRAHRIRFSVLKNPPAEGFIGGKDSGAGLIVTRPEELSPGSAALSAYVTNLFEIPCGRLFMYYYSDGGRLLPGTYFMLFEQGK